ncbi:MAG: ribonuclease III [Phycisphaeraceae bacterium]|nr:ribonuclease III [Phycisphaeraceae bacterium]
MRASARTAVGADVSAARTTWNAAFMTPDELQHAETRLGHAFGDRALLQQALTHASLVDQRVESNERLEFLGDAILGMVVCEALFRAYPDLFEGEMTKIKSLVVSRSTCADCAEEIGLRPLIRLGKGMSNRAHLPRSVLAAAFEAVVGAIYIDGGLEAARRFIMTRLEPRIEACWASGHQSNFKSVLQQAAQQLFDQSPQYVVLDEKGPDHAKCFEIRVELGGKRYPACWGASKKRAEQDAALEALIDLGLAERLSDGAVRILDAEPQAVAVSGPASPGTRDGSPEGGAPVARGPRVLDFDDLDAPDRLEEVP